VARSAFDNDEFHLTVFWSYDSAGCYQLSSHTQGWLGRQTVHTHRASVHQTTKLAAALLRVAGVTVGLAESNGSLPLGL